MSALSGPFLREQMWLQERPRPDKCVCRLTYRLNIFCLRRNVVKINQVKSVSRWLGKKKKNNKKKHCDCIALGVSIFTMVLCITKPASGFCLGTLCYFRFFSHVRPSEGPTQSPLIFVQCTSCWRCRINTYVLSVVLGEICFGDLEVEGRRRFFVNNKKRNITCLLGGCITKQCPVFHFEILG